MLKCSNACCSPVNFQVISAMCGLIRCAEVNLPSSKIAARVTLPPSVNRTFSKKVASFQRATSSASRGYLSVNPFRA